MTALSGSLRLSRAVLTETVEDPNLTPRSVVAGTASGVGGGPGKSDEISQTGAFRTYGNGNTRLILGAAQSRSQTLAFRALSPDQVQTIKDLIGHTVCYRDPYGRRIFGAFIGLQIQDIPFSGVPEDNSLMTDVGLVIQSVTYDEVV